MEANLTPSRLDGLREKVKALAGSIFSAPYLPKSLILFYIVVTLSNGAVILMGQPLDYWREGPQASGSLPVGIPELAAWWIAYFVIALICLSVFNYRWSLIGWLGAVYMHLASIVVWLEECPFGRWSPALGGMCESFPTEIAWETMGLILGIVLALTLRPAGFVLLNEKVTRWATRFASFLPLGWVALLLAGVYLSGFQQPASGWVPLELEVKPGPLQEAEAAYDVARGQLILFGGNAGPLGNGRWDEKNDTWIWNGDKWRLAEVAEKPPVRVGHGMAYDEKRDVVVMFGGFSAGSAYDDTWEWDGEKWEKQCPCDHPAARFGHKMIYDPVREKVVLYGGFDGKTTFNDAWEWDGEACNWNEIELEEGAPPNTYFGMTYVPEKGYALALLTGSENGGTWKWSGDAWTRLDPPVEPTGRARVTLAYDPLRELFVAFGGLTDDFDPLGDTWLFDGSTWTQYSGVYQPSLRGETLMWYDMVREHVMLFGGYYSDITFNDTWEFIPPVK